MKITFDTNIQQPLEGGKTEARRSERSPRQSGAAYRTEFFGDAQREWEQPAGGEKKKGRTARDIQSQAAGADAALYQNFMTVMSHTLSQEDYARLEEQGFRLEDMEPGAAVTIVDKIKAELARSGQQIAGYTDDLDLDTLAEAVGSRGLAQAIADSFREADIPATEENIEDTARAVDMASGLEAPTDGELRYMLDNQMEPEIRDYYFAESSGAGRAPSRGPRYYADGIDGYYAESAAGADAGELQEQVEKALSRLGFEASEENRAAALWLVENGIPLNAENLTGYRGLSSVEFPVEARRAAKAAARAIAEGREADGGNLSGKGSVYEEAARHLDYYASPQAEQGLDLAGRRRLEEIRLRMTAEVNVKLLRSGFSIDTAPMEELIDALKTAELQVAQQYFPAEENPLPKYEQYRDTCRMMAELPDLPAAALGPWAVGGQAAVRQTAGARPEGLQEAGMQTVGTQMTGAQAAVRQTADLQEAGTRQSGDAAGPDENISDSDVENTLARFFKESSERREGYRRAGESYEALKTEPRRDLGDSIHKAFANVDEILQELGLSCTEENRKAARILGYNRMDITEENVELVNRARERVDLVIEKMTPAATLKMIRDGMNPLEKSFEELQDYFNTLPVEYGERAESYSRFLYGLEKNNEITPEEREAYIGIYRLLHQVESSDAAAVGAVVSTGAELNFSSLLSASRSRRAKSMDVRVDDSFGGLSGLIRSGASISEQIAKGYGPVWDKVLTEVSQTESASVSYREQERQTMRQAVEGGEAAAALLQRGQITASAGNLLAALTLMSDGARLFARWSGKTGGGAVSPGSSESVWNDMTTVSEEGADGAAAPGEGASAAAYGGVSTAGGAAEIDRVWESLESEEAFRAGYQTLMEDLGREVESATMEAGSCLDVKSLRLLHRQLSIAGRLAQQEEFHVPLEINGELTAIHLTIRRQEAGRGQVGISMDLEDTGRMEGLFRINDGRLSGYFAGNGEETVTKLKQAADIFHDNIPEELQTEEILVVNGEPAAVDFGGKETEKGADGKMLYRVAKEFLAAVKTVFS